VAGLSRDAPGWGCPGGVGAVGSPFARVASPAPRPGFLPSSSPDGAPKEPSISVADPSAEPPEHRSRPGDGHAVRFESGERRPLRDRYLTGPLGRARRQLRRVPRPVLIGLLALTLVAGLVATEGLAAADRVRHGVRVGGVDLSGLTQAAAAARLRAAAGPIEAWPVVLEAGAARMSLPRSRAGLQLDAEASVAAAMAVGRRGPFDANRLKGWFTRIDLPWRARMVPARLDRQLTALDRRMGRPVREPTLRIGTAPGAGGAVPVELVAGRPGRAIDRAGAEAALLTAAAVPAGTAVRLPIGERPPSIGAAAATAAADRAGALLAAPIQVTVPGRRADLPPAELAPLIRTEAGEGDLVLRLDPRGLDRLLHRRASFAYTEPGDARFEPAGRGIRIVPAVTGRRVDPKKAAADVLAAGTAAAAGSTRRVALPTIAIQPGLTTKEAKALGVKEVVSTFTTTFSAGDAPRVHNIGLIAAAAHGSLVRPGEVFSMNQATGQRTAAKGYRTAHVIRNGEIVDGLGGGVCQAGTTMFNAAFFAGLPVVQRRNHSLHISHYPMGRDATLNWPDTDLRFRNDSRYGIYITGRATVSTLTFTLWSTSRGYKVSSSTSAASNFRSPPTRYEDDPKLPKGEEVVEESGSSGFDVTVYRTVTRGGQVVRRDRFVSNYVPWTRVVRRGTKDVPKPGDADPA
jgi:vancomycin resistance protein YoaR